MATFERVFFQRSTSRYSCVVWLDLLEPFKAHGTEFVGLNERREAYGTEILFGMA